MTISELQAKLEELKQKYGELPVYYWDDWTDFPVLRIQYIEADDDSESSLNRPVRVGVDGGKSY